MPPWSVVGWRNILVPPYKAGMMLLVVGRISQFTTPYWSLGHLGGFVWGVRCLGASAVLRHHSGGPCLQSQNCHGVLRLVVVGWLIKWLRLLIYNCCFPVCVWDAGILLCMHC